MVKRAGYLIAFTSVRFMGNAVNPLLYLTTVRVLPLFERDQLFVPNEASAYGKIRFRE